MSFLELLLYPGVLIGCLIGIGVAAFLRWLFPNEDLVYVQALMILLFIGLGVLVEAKITNRKD